MFYIIDEYQLRKTNRKEIRKVENNEITLKTNISRLCAMYVISDPGGRLYIATNCSLRDGHQTSNKCEELKGGVIR